MQNTTDKQRKKRASMICAAVFIGILGVYDPCRLLRSGHRLPELFKLFRFDELRLTYSLYLIIVDIELSGLIELCGHGITLFMTSHFVRREYEPPA